MSGIKQDHTSLTKINQNNESVDQRRESFDEMSRNHQQLQQNPLHPFEIDQINQPFDVSDLFQPLAVNTNLKNLTQSHILSNQIKGGGSNDPQNTSNSFQHQLNTMQSPIQSIQPNLTQPNSLQNPLNSLQMVSPAPLLMPLIPNQVPLIQNQDLLTIYNVQNMQTEDSFHQNLQRAFLQSAMAQNIQIQQQLLAQNQALQQLLHRQQQNKEEFKESKIEQREDANEKLSRTARNVSKVSKSLETFEIDTKTHIKDTELTSQSHFKRSSFSYDDTKEFKDAKISNFDGGSVPIPPPMPNFLIHDTDDIEKRPFMDPYGRAKTVRIGKWRWPPPKDDGNSTNHHPGGEDYMQFKMRQQVQRKITPGKENIRSEPMLTPQSSIDWDEIDFETNASTSTNQSKSIQPGTSAEKNQSKSSNKRSFEVGASRPSPGSIGKLKLSSEMRQRLEKVTFNHSVRSKNDEKPSRTVNKLEDTRKLMLERQLGGRFEQDSQVFDDFEHEIESKSSLSEIKMSVTIKNEKNEQSHQNYPVFSTTSQSSFKISPPPPPIGPNSRNLSTFLPPAPQIPAPPPPIRPQNHQFDEIDDINEQYQPKINKDIIPKDGFKEKDQKGNEKHLNTTNMGHGGLKKSSFSSNWDLDEKRSVEGGGLNEFEHLDDEEIWRNEEDERWEKKHPTFRDHQFSRKKSSVSTMHTEKDVLGGSAPNWGATPDFLLPTPPDSPKNTKSVSNTKPNILNLNQTPFLTYNRVSWVLRLRKEVFRPLESLGAPSTIHLIYCQVVLDVFGTTGCPRLNQNEKKSGKNVLANFGIDLNNFLTSFGLNIKRNIVEMARNWPLYFARLFKVSGAAQLSEVEILAVSHWGLHLVKKQANSLQVIKSYPLNEVQTCTSPRPTTLTLEFTANVKPNNINSNKVTLWSVRAQQINEMVNKFCGENKKLQSKFSSPIKVQQHPPPPSERLESMVISAEDSLVQETVAKVGPKKRDVTPPPPSSGRYSLHQFAEKHFRNYSDQDNLKGDHNQLKHKENLLKSPQKLTKKYQMDLVRYQATPLENSLLKFEDPELDALAVECFECILRYCGDLPLTQDLSEVKCVYTVLMHCHKHSALRDEIYCQLIKQTTLTSYSNQSQVNNESFQRAWRLLSILAAYFTCSESLLPYLVDHLTSFTSDKHRNFHGTASVCLLNLRKTQKFGGRKNVPSIEEVTAVSAGRNFRRQIYRLPGGGERVVNTKNSTVVQDVIDELCELIGIGAENYHNDLKNDQRGLTNYRSETKNTIRNEKEEFSLYCIVQGDSFTMPLSFDEYILDVTTELQKTNQVFYLIFCRSIWFYPLKSNPNPLYIEILFNQLAPDYLEGLLLILPSQQNQNQHSNHQNYMLNPNVINDIAFIAALLHRSADLKTAPNLKEVKFLLPKPILTLKEPKPSQWLSLVQSSWLKISSFSPITSKFTFLNVLKSWNLFGSSFFAVKLVQNTSNSLDSSNRDYILALNRNGIHFLDLITHETMKNWPFSEVISTRKVKSEEGVLFLDLKCGNLMQQRVTRLQTEQAHEISRLIRGYINLEQVENGKI